MNIKFEKEIYICGMCVNYLDYFFNSLYNLKIGLININFDKIFWLEDFLDMLNVFKISFKFVVCKCKIKGWFCEGNFKFFIKLLENFKLLIKYENVREEYYSFLNVFIIYFIWFVFEFLNVLLIWIL